jgi:hypothetical protein
MIAGFFFFDAVILWIAVFMMLGRILDAINRLNATLREIADSKTHITFTSDPDARRSSIERHYGS